jgi:glycosyltransferase involved in cell wall biosynthesis
MNCLITKKFIESGVSVKILNTAPSYAARFFNSKLWVIMKFLHNLFCFVQFFLMLLKNENKIIYRSINGGLGQFYDFFYLLLCRLFSKDLIIHHHSFKYLNKKSIVFLFLNKLTGHKTTHIVLGLRMKILLCELYNLDEDQVLVLSNLSFFPKEDDLDLIALNKKIKIGYLANCSIEKGIDTFIDVCSILKKSNVDFEAIIVGPFSNNYTERIVNNALNHIPQIKYLGPLYNKEKNNFLKSLDLFVFPSRYIHEAEPLVLYEAGLYGALLIGSKIGCTEEMLDELGGVSYHNDSELAENIASLIIKSNKNLSFNKEAKLDRIALFKTKQNNKLILMESFINSINDTY